MPDTFARFTAELEALDSSKRFNHDELETVYGLAHSLYVGSPGTELEFAL